MKKQKNKPDKKPSYIFPDFLAEVMSKVDPRTQYEASMLSMSMLCIGLVLSTVYAWAYLDLQLWFKITLTINSFFGILFMWSFIITTYQQYLAYMDSRALDDLINKPIDDIQPKGLAPTKQEVKEMKKFLPDAEVRKALGEDELFKDVHEVNPINEVMKGGETNANKKN